MRIAIALVIAACGGSATKSPPQTISGSAPQHAPPSAPVVANAAVLAAEDATTTPPVMLLIDASGQRSLASAPSWADLAAGKYSAGPKPAKPQPAWMHLKEGIAMGKDPKSIVDGFVESVEVPYVGSSQDDPPPPEEEDKPDDGEEESGGTGTAMALDEGKMGRKDAPPGNPALTLDEGKMGKKEAPRRKSTRQGYWGPTRGADDPRPSRAISTLGEIGAPLEPQPAVIVAAPTAKASEVIAAISETQAMIGVAYQGTIRRLRLQFVRARDSDPIDPPRVWVELRFTADGVELEAVPEVPIAAKLDADFATKLATAAKRRNAEKEPVDVLVAPDTTAQRLVDVLVALDAAGVRTIGLGLAPQPGSDAAKLRGHRSPTVSLGAPNAQGDLDKKLIRETVRKHRDAILACYAQRLAKKPGLEGTVQTQFFIAPTGKVAQASGSGVDVDVANCVAAVIKKIEFTKPKGGGGVQVNYPFTFRN